MPQMLVRNLEEEIVDRLRAKARLEGVSAEEMARRAIREAVRPTYAELLEEIDRIRVSPPPDFDSLTELRRLRDGDDDANR